MIRNAFVITVLSIGLAVPSGGQGLEDHPLMNGEVRSDFSESAQIIMVRSALQIDTETKNVAGSAHIQAISDEAGLVSAFLKVDDLEVHSVIVEDDSVSWSVADGVLTTVLDFSDRNERSFQVDYSVRSALHFRSEDDEWSMVWSSSLPGRSGWIPTPLDELTPFDIVSSISTPSTWKLITTNASGNPSFATETGDYSSFHSSLSFSHQSGFIAFDSTAIVVRSNASAGIKPFISSDSLRSELLESSRSHLGAKLGFGSDGLPMLFLVPGALEMESFDGFALVPLLDKRAPSSWEEEYLELEQSFALHLRPKMTHLLPTDRWISPALAGFLAIDMISEFESEAAAGFLFEQLRKDYLEEAKEYVRPLVWDRWDNASDLMDVHSRAKGAWVLKMLEERLGERAFFEGIRLFLTGSADEVLDSESLRESFEAVSREDLRGFFDVWVYSAGHPELSIEHSFDVQAEEATVQIVQHQEGQLVPEAFEFDAAFQYSSLAETNTLTIRIKEQRQTTSFPSSIAPRFVHADAFAHVLLDFQSTPALNDLVSQLRYSVDVSSTLRSLSFMSEMELSPSTLLGLRSSLSVDSSPEILYLAAPLLAKMTPSGSAFSMLSSWAGSTDIAVKAAALKAISAFPSDSRAFSTALDAANTGRDGRVLSAAVFALSRLRPENAWAYLQSALVTESEADRVRLDALDLIDEQTASKEDVFDTIGDFFEGGVALRAASLNALFRVDPSDDLVAQTIEEWLASDLSSLRNTAIALLERSEQSATQPDVLHQALEREPYPVLRRRISALIAREQELQ